MGSKCKILKIQVHIWDIRQATVVGSLIGPKICGDAIDIKGNYILTGAHRLKDQLQLWNLGTQKLVHTFKWDNPVFFDLFSNHQV